LAELRLLRLLRLRTHGSSDLTLEGFGRGLRDSSPASDSFHLLDLEVLHWVLLVLLAEALVLLIDIQDQLLDMTAGSLVLVIVSTGNA
jgi:hypothetical protein